MNKVLVLAPVCVVVTQASSLPTQLCASLRQITNHESIVNNRES